MDLTQILTIAQIVLSLVLIFLILSQSQGTGLSLTFGGGGSFYRSKRGVEKLFFYGTIIVAILFVGNALAIFYL